jgi:hypothetical protein
MARRTEVKARHVPLLALALAATLAAGAVASTGTTKQRVAIEAKLHQTSFVLIPLQVGAMKRDSGSITEHAAGERCRDVIRDGQKVDVCTGGRRTLTGRRGTLTIRERVEWVDPGSGGCGVAFGTWTVVRGTGAYADVVGGGRSAYDAHCATWYARFEGYLTSP